MGCLLCCCKKCITQKGDLPKATATVISYQNEPLPPTPRNNDPHYYEETLVSTSPIQLLFPEPSAPSDSTDGTTYIALHDYVARVSLDLNFKKSQLLLVISTDDADWWYARSLVTHEEGYIPRAYVAPEKSYESEEWYFGNIKRIEAERELMADGLTSGTFLIRASESKEGDFSLSMRKDKCVKHYKIQRSPDGKTYFITETATFFTLQELVQYYRSDAEGALACPLTKACPEEKPLIATLSKDAWEIKRESLLLKRMVGSGKFGEVWIGLWNNYTQVAVKTLKEGSMSPKSFLEEAGIMKNLRHKHLVTLYAICSDREPFYIVTEYMCNGSLLHYLRVGDGAKLEQRILIDMMLQVACGMSYLESQKYIHRDLAARNVLVGTNNTCKVADFGLSRFLLESDYYRAQEGSKLPIKWSSIESILYGKFTIMSDVWSFGILMTEIITKGIEPYPGMSNRETIQTLELGNRMALPRGCPSTLFAIMEQCWYKDPQTRPSFKELQTRLEEFMKSLNR